MLQNAIKLKLCRMFCSLTKISTKKMYNDKCYFRHVINEDKIHITFRFPLSENKLRQFNFSRQPSESISNLMDRISSNINKFMLKKSKKGNSANADKLKMDISLSNKNGNKIIENMSCLEMFNLENPVELKIGDCVFEVVFNSPWVDNIELPQYILAGFFAYPEYFVSMYTEADSNIFNWYCGNAKNEKGNLIADIHIDWKFRSTGFIYIPSVEDVGLKLKLECIPANKTSVGPPIEVISKDVIQASPGFCPFETRHMFTNSKLSNQSFRCVSYNILADLYCDSDYTRTELHPYCPPYALHIDYRKQLITKELIGYNADIICLQEVDQKIFQHCLTPLLGLEELDGKFYKKGKEVSEGLACFYRKTRFCFVDEKKLLLSEAVNNEEYLKPIWNVVKNNLRLVERLLDRSTVASATILQSIDNADELLIVGNTHLYFHPDADHIRLLQAGIVIYWLNDLKENLKQKFSNKRVTLILSGDFNSVPSCGVYQLYTTGIATKHLPDWKSNEEEKVENLALTNNTLLASACGTPTYTNFTAGFADCLDYIYYEKSNLEVEQVIPFPSIEELKANIALPSIVFPSDHIALVSDLHFLNYSSNL